jgi:two-component sensor histidine kinase
MKAELHPSEAARIAALRSYDILDSPREEDFDEVVQVLAAICEAPISVINLLDSGRQWFKAEVGLGVRETPLDSSICAHAILQPGLFVVPDTLRDPRFADNTLVTGAPHLRFYAGAPLQTPEGLPLGTVCVLDYKPRELTQVQGDAIRLMARQVMRQLELRRLLRLEHSARQEAELLAGHNAILVREVDHRVKNSLQLVSSLLGLQARRSKSPEVQAQLAEAEGRLRSIAAVHQQLYLAGQAGHVQLGNFLGALCREISENRPSNIDRVECQLDPADLESDRAVAIGLVLNEALVNAFKHAFPGNRQGLITVKGKRCGGDYHLTVTDNGVGMGPPGEAPDHEGLGLRVLHAMVERLEGEAEFGGGAPGSASGASISVSFPISTVAAKD